MRMQPARAAILGLSLALLLAGCGLTDARDAAIANAKVKPLDMKNSLRPGLVGMPDYPSSGWEPGQASPSPTPTPSNPGAKNPLAAVGLRASDMAAGNVIAAITDGTSLGVPTLDFCAAKYPSESTRVKRLQVGAYDKSGVFIGLSSEVVVYESAQAAKQALAEVISARLKCTPGTTFKTYDGHKLVFAFHKAPEPPNTPLVGADSRLIVHTTMQVDGNPQTAFLVYQIDGPVLAALYASDATGKPLAQASLDGLYGLAGRIANRLRAYVSGKPVATSPSDTKAV
jgi:hypothetical protein